MPRKKKPDAPKPKVTGTIDAEVGRRLRMARVTNNMSQEQVGKAVSLTFQQIQKYERGSNRLSVSRLLQLCELLKVQPLDLIPWDGVRNNTSKNNTPMVDSSTIELVREFERLTPEMKTRFRHLMAAINE